MHAPDRASLAVLFEHEHVEAAAACLGPDIVGADVGKREKP